jgi:hypothetical protein
MNIEMRPLCEIQPYLQNPRHNDPAVDAVATSIREFGFRQPVVLDENDVIVVGHTRYKAAIKLGLERVPVHVAHGLTPAQIKAYRLADNQTATLASWDDDRLTQELMELQGMGFDLDVTGFSADELLRLTAPEATEGPTDADAIPEPPDEATTRPGDLWLLGTHRLFCGDAGKAEDVDRLLEGAPIHVVNSDPPYNVKLEPRSRNAIGAGLSSFEAPPRHLPVAKPARPKLRPRDRPLANDFVGEKEFDQLLRAWFANLSRALLPGRAFYL